MKKDPYKTYTLRFPKEYQKELQEKLKYKRFLQSEKSLHIPKNAWLAFLTPPHPDAYKKLKKNETHIKKLKEKVLDIFARPKQFVRAKDVRRSSAIAITTTLLEILFDLEEKKVLLNKKEYEMWIEIAERFGLWQLRQYLEDAVFKNFDPEHYSIFQTVVEKKMKTDARLVTDMRFIITKALEDAGLKDFDVRNRTKNVYGVYQKMQHKGRKVNDIYDIHGFRVLTKDKEDCYRAFDALQRLWPQYRDRHKDYIQNPKDNGYQSIHIVLRTLNRVPIEFQIRSFEMDVIAESGPANHADYKKYYRDAFIFSIF